jgi:hypothetical protein
VCDAFFRVRPSLVFWELSSFCEERFGGWMLRRAESRFVPTCSARLDRGNSAERKTRLERARTERVRLKQLTPLMTNLFARQNFCDAHFAPLGERARGRACDLNCFV